MVTAVVTAQASMTPMTNGLHLSPEASAIVATIYGAVVPRFDQIQGKIGLLAGQLTTLQTHVGCLKADVGNLRSEVGHLGEKVQRQDQRMTEV